MCFYKKGKVNDMLKNSILWSLLAMTASASSFPPANHLYGIRADHRAFDTICVPEIPKADTDGKYPTMNKTGLMTHDRDPFSEAYMHHAQETKGNCLEIGAAYGITTLPTLETGATVVANDIDPGHLLVLQNRTPKTHRDRLYLNFQSFPDETSFPENTFDAILICRVIHLFTPEMAEKSLEQAKRWLKPGGRIYITALTPFHYGMTSFVETYNDRWKKGDLWPGVIKNFHDYFPSIKQWAPQYVHIMDDRPLCAALNRHGFKIVQASFYDYDRPNKSKRTGKEYFGVIAEKKGDKCK
jgi:SAM-dependent methyltransferase